MVWWVVAFVKLYVKMSAHWFKRLFLLIWACIVCCENVFSFWTSFCERHKLNRLPNSDGTVLALKKTQRVVLSCFNCVGFMSANGCGVIVGAQMIFDCKKITIETRRGKLSIRIERYHCQNADISTLLWKMLACSTKSTTAFAFSKNHLKSRRFRLWTSFPSCF